MQFNQTNNNLGDVNNAIIGQDLAPVAHQHVSIWSRLNTWYGFLASTASLLGIWLFGWQQWHWWFFGL